MTISIDQRNVAAVLEAVRQAHYDRNAAAIDAQFSRNAAVYDLAPPLAHTSEVQELHAWLNTWDGPVHLDNRDPNILVSGDLAVCYGLQKTSGTRNGQPTEWWQRMTVCLSRVGGTWKIVHENTSVPLYMDGSSRAALDLNP